jgi:glycosyltransferase involved in cell wall biosynthesis
VVVAVLTYRRPAALPEALAQVVEQLDQVERASVLVVDNDTTPSAAAAVARVAARDPRVRYVHEPEPGIAAARNRAMVECGPDDLLVFIDDDERPSRSWLATLVGAWEQYRSAAVVGPVVSTFVAEPDDWITAGRYFQRLRHATGATVRTAATNNLLLDLAQVRHRGLTFDHAFGLTGGSDTVFTRQLSALGGRIVWCDEALVYDAVPPERSTRAWVRARASRLGNADSRASIYLAPPRRRLLVRLGGTARGAVRVAVGGARVVYGTAAGSATHHARGTRTLLRGVGMVRGSWGHVVHEYGRS